MAVLHLFHQLGEELVIEEVVSCVAVLRVVVDAPGLHASLVQVRCQPVRAIVGPREEHQRAPNCGRRLERQRC